MSDEPARTAPYGTWPSPITAEMVASAGVDFGHVALDGVTVYCRERRPGQSRGTSIDRHHDSQE